LLNVRVILDFLIELAFAVGFIWVNKRWRRSIRHVEDSFESKGDFFDHSIVKLLEEEQLVVERQFKTHC
jgi:hypothetical protein